MKKISFEEAVLLVKKANDDVQTANDLLWQCLSHKVHTLIKNNNINDIEELVDSLPECFTKYTLHLHLDRLKKKKIVDLKQYINRRNT
jgi:hypothetical protein